MKCKENVYNLHDSGSGSDDELMDVRGLMAKKILNLKISYNTLS